MTPKRPYAPARKQAGPTPPVTWRFTDWAMI